jgi:hypothetical protein
MFVAARDAPVESVRDAAIVAEIRVCRGRHRLDGAIAAGDKGVAPAG